MDYLVAAKDAMKLAIGRRWMLSMGILYALIALVERLDRVTGHDADGNPMIRTKEGR